MRKFFFTLFTFVVACGAFATNEDLDTVEAPVLGERVAGYLQTMVTAVSQTMSVKPSTNPVLRKEPYLATITYNFDLQGIDVSLIGTQTDEDTVKAIIEFTKKLILGFNKKLDYNFGITLEEQDLNIEYQNVKENQVMLRYQGGFYSTPNSKTNQ